MKRFALPKKKENKRTEPVKKARAPQSRPRPVQASVNHILHLQQTIGNQAVQRMIKSGTLQLKANRIQRGNGYPREVKQLIQRIDSDLLLPQKTNSEPVAQHHPITSLFPGPVSNNLNVQFYFTGNEPFQFNNEKQKAYLRGYNKGYVEGFPEGLEAGLDELVDNEVLLRSQANLIYESVTSHIVINKRSGWNASFMIIEDIETNYEEGESTGRGFGYDDGYEKAITQYGYSRKYQAIPGPNKITASQDNNGICVYCNNAAIEDIDHIQPLKYHWLEKGAMQDLQTRSDEANDTRNLVGSCATCNRSKGAKRLNIEWWPASWGGTWWPYGPVRVTAANSPPPYW
jgi:hypothetical protein